jgi:L-serine/L-threonine ammonia-lyase
MKLDNLQPSGSFKSRGIGNLMLRAIQSHGPSKPIHFYCSSGGNAGLACVNAAIALDKPATIVVPVTTSALMIGKLRTLGANVHQHGASWLEADTYLHSEFLDNDPNGVYVPPFDHEDIWDGAATLVEEIDQQIGDYDAVVCNIGGGGLFCGIMEGLSRRKTGKSTKVLAVETKGADSLTQAIAKGEHITLPEITSIATSLGARKVAKKAFQWAQKEEVTCLTLSDAEAAMGSVSFADDERFLVEVACGVSIAAVYGGHLRDILGRGMSDDQWKRQRIVVVVCGGNNVNLGILEGYREKYGKAAELNRKAKSLNQAQCGVRWVDRKITIEALPDSSKTKDESGYLMPVEAES